MSMTLTGVAATGVRTLTEMPCMCNGTVAERLIPPLGCMGVGADIGVAGGPRDIGVAGGARGCAGVMTGGGRFAGDSSRPAPVHLRAA